MTVQQAQTSDPQSDQAAAEAPRLRNYISGE
jgi:hypothetical protein